MSLNWARLKYARRLKPVRWLLAGVVANTLIAWFLASGRVPTSNIQIAELRQGAVPWILVSSRRPGFEWLHFASHTATPDKNDDIPLPSLVSLPDLPILDRADIVQVSSGWPLRSFRAVGSRTLPNAMERRQFPDSGYPLSWDCGLVLSESRGAVNPAFYGVLVLPLQPIWLPFVVNSLLYACLLGSAVTALGIINRHRRAARGSCLQCGYDLRSAPAGTCPECGFTEAARVSPPRRRGGRQA